MVASRADAHSHSIVIRTGVLDEEDISFFHVVVTPGVLRMVGNRLRQSAQQPFFPCAMRTFWHVAEHVHDSCRVSLLPELTEDW